MRKKSSARFIVALLCVAVIVSALAFGEFFPVSKWVVKPKKNELATITSPKVKKIFCYLQQNQEDIEKCLCKIGPLTEHEINIAYQTAVDLYKYELAIKLYNMGASDCYKEGQDILFVSINFGDLKLADKLVSKNYPLELYHLNAVRSLLNTDQPNWAFINHKNDVDSKGYEDYQKRVESLAEKMIALYKIQNKQEPVPFPETFNAQEKYERLFGKNSQKAFENLVEQTLQKKYSFSTAIHGSQKACILLDDHGKKIGVIKSRNELLAKALDKDYFAGVPPVIEVNIPEKGDVILQKWLPDSLMATEYKHLPMQTFIKIPNVLEELHHIRAIDIRIGNSDRNRGNLLVKKCGKMFHVVPIDHDLINHYIPSDINWESLYLNVPFSKVTQKKIFSIDLHKDAKIMEQLGYSLDEIKAMKLRTCLLKKGVENNLSLKQIDMLFRFFYYDFLEKVKQVDPKASEKEFQQKIELDFQKASTLVKKPTEVWKLIGNNFEFYI